MIDNLEKVRLLARDLRDRKQFPRSPRKMLAGYVLAARAVDKCRSVIVGIEGEYHSNCPVDKVWLDFTEINYDEFKSYLSTGANDEEMVLWILDKAKKHSKIEIIAWNNKQRDTNLSDLSPETQEYMEDYIDKYVPHNRVVYRWFDVYDLEEERL